MTSKRVKFAMCQINYTTTKNNGRLGEIMASNWVPNWVMMLLYSRLYCKRERWAKMV